MLRTESLKDTKHVIKGCSLALNQVPRIGSVKNPMECITGKDFITEVELTPKERVKCVIGAVAGIKDFMSHNIFLVESLE